MARRLDGSDRGVLITQESARRIQRVVQRIEGGDRNIPPLPIRTAFDDGGGELRVGKVAAAWAIGTCATVTIWNRTGSNCSPAVSSPTETVENVANLSHDVPADSWVVIGRAVDGNWYLLESGKEPDEVSGGSCHQAIGGEDITTWPGWNGSIVQLLGHDENGCLKWFDADECDEGSGS